MLLSHGDGYRGLGRPELNVPYRPSTKALTRPFAPKNVMVTSPYVIGKTDIRWDSPTLHPENSGLNILGCNVYRATESPFGTFVKVNAAPVGVLSYRDETKEEYVIEEDATPTLIPGTGPDGRWLIYSQFRPIVMPGTNGRVSTRVQDIKVEIDDGDATFLEEPAFKLNGITGEIELIQNAVYNDVLEQVIPPRLPWPPTGRVRISYTYIQHQVLSVLNQRIFYKVTTVAEDPDNPAQTIETPLDEIEAMSTFDMEILDWIWKEGIRRNRWILEQGGERVKVFLRRWMGTLCDSYQHVHGQSHHDCESCFGTNFVGGYEGPYDIIIAPPETERSVELADMGLHMRYDWLTWTTPYPILNPRDIIVRQNNERYIVGPVNYQGQRGAIFQQHFTISYLDEGDIRYKIPITGGETQIPESTNSFREPLKSEASPVIPVKPEIPEDKLLKGRTVTWENITW